MEAGKSSKSPPAGNPIIEKKRGFTIGPINLPDGVHRRKVQKIKKRLVRKAQIKKSYRKLKYHEPELFKSPGKTAFSPASMEDSVPAPSLELHPERQAMLDDAEPQPSPKTPQKFDYSRGGRLSRHSRPAPFQREIEMAQKRGEDRVARHCALEEANREREAKREEREMFRKAMQRAKQGGKSGNERRLGRESKVLLKKVQRMVQA